jgi:hypothetical protein
MILHSVKHLFLLFLRLLIALFYFPNHMHFLILLHLIPQNEISNTQKIILIIISLFA